MKNSRKNFDLKHIIASHVISNKKEYIVIGIFLIVGIFLGVLYINNIQEEQFNNVSDYINTFIEKLKTKSDIDNINLLKNSIIQNLMLAGILWFFGTTVIGIPIVFGIMVYRGFCLGYTISAVISILGVPKGLAFSLSNLLLQNLLLIPAILAIGVSGFKLYKSIVKDKRRENIKLEIIRHTVFCGVMAICLSLASVVEIFLSNNLLNIIVKYL